MLRTPSQLPQHAADTEMTGSESGARSGAPVIALPCRHAASSRTAPRTMCAAEVMATVGPGDGHAWADELNFLWTVLRHRVLDVLDSVLVEGFREPIVLGPDGRLWDGHHRVAVALALDLEVPVVYAGKGGEHA